MLLNSASINILFLILFGSFTPSSLKWFTDATSVLLCRILNSSVVKLPVVPVLPVVQRPNLAFIKLCQCVNMTFPPICMSAMDSMYTILRLPQKK